jgi:ABC-2 type transport system ATP-binding protein
MPAIIRTSDLTKYYGKARGVIDLDLEVQPGEVFGYLGPNGAGKTTTIRLLLDFIRPTSGRAEVLGLDSHAQSIEIRRRTGYIPGDLVLYENMTGRELLRYFGHLRGGVEWKRVTALAERLDLDMSRQIKALSKGNKQKIGLVQAFMHAPELLVLDEPTSGLDPLVQQEFYRLLREVKAAGTTVFLSSHVMSEVEHICDRVGIIRDGKLVLIDEVGRLKANAVRRFEIEFARPVPGEVFDHLPNVSDVSVENGFVRCTVSGPVDALVKVAAQYEVNTITSHEPDLEEIFLSYYGGERYAA